MMRNNSTVQKARRPLVVRWAIWALCGVGCLGLLLIAVLIWLVLRDRTANAQLQERVGELKAAKLPYDSASLAEYYAQAADDRSVDQWRAVLDTLHSDTFSESTQGIGPWRDAEERESSVSETWPDELETLDFLQTWSGLRDEARRLALQDHKVHLPIDFDSLLSESVHSDSTRLQDVRQLGRLFSVEAQVAIRGRDSAATRDAILGIFGCARCIEGQPLFISQLVGTALESMASEQLRDALEADVLQTDDLKRVQARIDKRPGLETVWRTAMHGERASMLPAFGTNREDSQKMHGGAPAVWLPGRSRDALTFVQLVDQAVALPADDLDEFRAGMSELDERIEAKARSRNWLTRMETTLSSLAMPMISAARDALIQREMLARLATLGIGVRLYEDEHSVLPDNLEQLSQLGLDLSTLKPLGDQPFGYRNEGNLSILWGFQLQQHKSTPDKPPAFDNTSEDAEPVAKMLAQQNRRWVWKFPKANP